MSHLLLSQEETQILAHLIQYSIRDLKSEIIHTDNWEYKADLKERKQMLLGLLDRVNQIKPAVGAD